MQKQDCEQSQYYQEDFLASHSLQPGSAEARRMTVISGRKCCELYRKSGPLGSLVRTLLVSSAWRSTRCYLTWKASATPARRLLFRLVPSTPRTEGIDAQLLPTPTVNDAINSSLPPSQIVRASLVGKTMKALLFPTATTGAGLCGGSANYQRLKDLEAGRAITSEERRSMAAGNGGQLNPTWVEWLMGFPLGWTDLSASETPSCPSSSTPSSGQ